MPAHKPLRPANVLAAIEYGEAHAGLTPMPRYYIANRQLGGALREVWTSTEPPHFERHDDVALCRTDTYLAGFVQTAVCKSSIEWTSQMLMRKVLRLVTERGYSRLLRFWNYVPAINRAHDGLEHYHRFCIGRHKAFIAHGCEIARDAPAATAVGHIAQTLAIFFIATNRPLVAIENPRQLSAYRYPRQYGPRSPSFARAVLSGDPRKGDAQLFLSGTASIVGHRSLHDNATAQTEETLLNIRVLIEQAERQCGALFDWNDAIALKVYLRNVADLARVKEMIAAVLPTTQTLFLQADICRSELKVEIEGVWNCRSA